MAARCYGPGECVPLTRRIEVYDCACVLCPYRAIAMSSGAAAESLLYHLGYAHPTPPRLA